MILCKFTKTGSAAYLPHLDILRAVGMAIRRRGLSISYSEGFNPHMQLYFNQPLPLGTQSECEYFCAASQEPAERFMSEMNLTLPSGVRIVKAEATEGNPNIAAVMKAADYFVRADGYVPTQAELDETLGAETYTVRWTSKGKEQSKEVRRLIYGLTATDGGILMRLACGNENLRADRLTAALASGRHISVKGMDILKKMLYTEKNHQLTDVDEVYFRSGRTEFENGTDSH